jgi:hypothetical protein
VCVSRQCGAQALAVESNARQRAQKRARRLEAKFRRLSRKMSVFCIS